MTRPSEFRIEIGVPESGLFELPAGRVLRELPPGVALRHEALGFRHPLALYNVSVALVADRLARVLALLDVPDRTRAPDGGSRWEEDVTFAYDALLDALEEHLDDVDNVLLCFFPTAKARNASASNRGLLGGTAWYRNHIGHIDNALKHHQRRLRFVSATSTRGDDHVDGYYVEAAVGGVVGPDPAIHTHGRTAFSFNRDLRLHAAELIHVSEALAAAVATIAGSGTVRDDSAEAATTSPPAERPDPILDVLVWVGKLPGIVFPDELRSPWPTVTVDKSKPGAARVLANMPETPSARAIGSPFAMSVATRGDGVSRTFRIPYYGVPPAGGW